MVRSHELPRPRLRPEREQTERESSSRARRLREEPTQLLQEVEREGLLPPQDELAPLRQRPRRITEMVREKENRERTLSRIAPVLHKVRENRLAREQRLKMQAVRGVRALKRASRARPPS